MCDPTITDRLKSLMAEGHRSRALDRVFAQHFYKRKSMGDVVRIPPRKSSGCRKIERRDPVELQNSH